MFALFRSRFIYVLFFLSLFAYESYSRELLNPIDYGINKANNDVERYYILLKCHQDAVKYGMSISYKGIESISIEIPQDAITIPLPHYVDFANVNLIVRNNSKEIDLFTLKNELSLIGSLSGWSIDKGVFKDIKEISSGTYLLVIGDDTPWVINRTGYNYGASRRDVMLVIDGIGKNRPTASYNTIASKPIGKYCKVSRDEKVFKNLHFNRTGDSSEKTYLCNIQNQYNVRLENISITTPDNDVMLGDGAIAFHNCVKVTLNDIKIDGTYSQLHKFGYGVAINNIYDLKVNRMVASAKWGVFGTNNMNKVFLKDCDINRFDIHCYGNNVSFERCTFRNLYNQFSSFYGRLFFKDCMFNNFIPILLEPSYNAYTGFDVVIKNCTWQVNKRHPYLMMAGNPAEEPNVREELREKCWPNLTVKNLSLVLPDGIKNVTLYRADGDSSSPIGYINKVCINGIKLIGQDKLNVSFTNKKVKFKNKIEHKLNRCLGIDYFN